MRMLMKMTAGLAVASSLALSGAAFAADEGAFSGSAPLTVLEFRTEGTPETYGTASVSSLVQGAYTFHARQSTTAWSAGAGGNRFITTGGVMDVIAGAIPNGSQIERIEVEGCDNSATDEVSLNFGPCPTAGGTCNLAGSVATGGAATPGCGFFSTTLTTPVIVANDTTYILSEVATGTTVDTTWSAVRLFYRLRVSPAPATATFADVPTTSGQFRFVEALAAAGITGGCGGGNYCPNDPVTRGQMAVFLAAALGLHFPN